MSLLDEVAAEVTDDPESIGLILHGSRAAGVHGPDSDYDLVRVVTDASYAARLERGELREKGEVGALVRELSEAAGRLARAGLDELYDSSSSCGSRPLMESRGIGHEWGPEDDLEPVKALRFAEPSA